MLTRCMRARCIPNGRPLEAYPSIDNTGRDGKYICWCDLDNPETTRNPSSEICWGLCMYVHFRLVCKTWSHLNTFNGGMRQTYFPEGGATGPRLPREQLGNEQATMICNLCMLLHKHGYHFNIKNHLDRMFGCLSGCRGVLRI